MAGYEQVLNDLKKRDFKPIYFLSGDEPYYIDLLTDYILEHTLPEAERSFNQTIAYGKDTTASQLINIARRFPMMSAHQVVVLREAQDMKDFASLIHYIEAPLASTLLVINYKYKKPDKRLKVFASLKKHAVCVESKRLYDNQLPGWISAYAKKHKYSIEPKASALLAEFLGSDLGRIASEMDKLFIAVGSKNKQIDTKLIEKNTGISKDYNQLELSTALGERDALKANRIVGYFCRNPKNHHISLTIASLYYYFSKLLMIHYLKDRSKKSVASVLKIHPYFAGEYLSAAKRYSAMKLVGIISLLREYDMRSKGYGGDATDQGELQRELILKILYA
ncbi:MAG: DNA polymerase III subunit delta [Bacteroidetes bacterium]|nr:MAG: DNA polymerase III subunit delta [Bacteroidota bacterium]